MHGIPASFFMKGKLFIFKFNGYNIRQVNKTIWNGKDIL